MDSISDNALMLKVKNGDFDKLGLLFERYHRRLYHFFYRLNRRRDVSEDLVQGVFERILKYRSSYTADGSFSTWIFQIARNLHADHYRKHQNEENINDFLDMDQLVNEDENDQPGKEELKLLQRALDQLDSTKKQALLLSRFQGFKYKEIAEIMDCSEGAVKVRIFRAIRELEVLIKELKGV
ncbi:MAG TPA: RNA polymerase sigma factor [Balneolaceae bacterium]|nr:RNA polymerase sigma factor [Balneolaceae bacterium]